MAYLVHLRLQFQFLLSPIFLWGYLLASGKLDPKLIVAYLSFHLFGYAGGTAFNSSYDRDLGPIGGLEHPPPVPKRLLAFALAWQGGGFLLALAVNLAFAGIYAVMFCLSFAYSHPALRLKAKPLAALATVAIGQGMLAFLGGWSSARGDALSVVNQWGLLGLLAATLLTIGLYPLTQIYQLEEDARRGDMTFARFLGVRGSFLWAQLCIALGGGTAAWIVQSSYSWIEGLVLLIFVCILLVWIQAWYGRFGSSDVTQNFRSLMRLYAATSLPFLAWISLHLIIS